MEALRAAGARLIPPHGLCGNLEPAGLVNASTERISKRLDSRAWHRTLEDLLGDYRKQYDCAVKFAGPNIEFINELRSAFPEAIWVRVHRHFEDTVRSHIMTWGMTVQSAAEMVNRREDKLDRYLSDAIILPFEHVKAGTVMEYLRCQSGFEKAKISLDEKAPSLPV